MRLEEEIKEVEDLSTKIEGENGESRSTRKPENYGEPVLGPSESSESIPQTTAPLKQTADNDLIDRRRRMDRAYLIEGLVFQELQSEFDGTIRREVAFKIGTRLVQIDGIIESSQGPVLVEVKLAKNVSSALKLMETGADNLRYMTGALVTNEPSKSIRRVLAVVVEGDESDAQEIRDEVRMARDVWWDMNVISFSYVALLKKYGFPILDDEA